MKGDGIKISQADVDEFFKDMATPGQKRRVYTDFEQSVILAAYERGYNKKLVAQKLKTTPEGMKIWYEEYIASKVGAK